MNSARHIQEVEILSSIDAYDLLAPWYRCISEERLPYLCRVEDIVIRCAPRGGAMLDVGAGDGWRAMRIARSAELSRVVLLEPSAGMRAQCPGGVEIWPCSVPEIPETAPPFDIITCLWNVLGHVPETWQRERMLAEMRKRLAPGGAIFLDVSHRYNAASYGWRMTFLRMALDFLLPSNRRGDVVVSWNAGGKTVRTHGHVFTHREIRRLVRSAGLKIIGRWVVDYETGIQRRMPLSGHLLYQLAAAPASRREPVKKHHRGTEKT